MLALDLREAIYIVGKLAGFVAIAFVLALAVSVPLVPVTDWIALVQWATSLAFELPSSPPGAFFAW